MGFFCLSVVNISAIPLQALQWRHLRRENSVKLRLFLFPMLLIGLNGEVGFGLKKVIKTALVHTGTLTNVAKAHSPIAIFPEKLRNDLEQLVFRGARFCHKLSLIQSLFLLNTSTFSRVDCSVNCFSLIIFRPLLGNVRLTTAAEHTPGSTDPDPGPGNRPLREG